MVCRLLDFALVVLDLLMFKVCGIIGISKIGYSNFSGNERVNFDYPIETQTNFEVFM